MMDGRATVTASKELELQIAKVLDEALETLRWCRQNPQNRRAGEVLRELEGRLGYLAQALSWQIEGDAENAAVALGVAQGQSRREQEITRQMWEEMWWSH